MSPGRSVARRERLGGRRHLGGQEKIYLFAGGLEIDDLDHYRITRKRVFFDDVLYVSYRRYRGTWYLVACALLGAFAALPGALMLFENVGAGLALLLVFGTLPAYLFLSRLLFGMDEIRVYGTRTRATLCFPFRKQRARRIYEDLLDRIRRAQEPRPAEAPADAPPLAGPAPAPSMPEVGFEPTRP